MSEPAMIAHRPHISADLITGIAGWPAMAPMPSVVKTATPAATKPTVSNLLRLRTRRSIKIAPAVVASRTIALPKLGEIASTPTSVIEAANSKASSWP